VCLTYGRPEDTELYDLAADPNEMTNLAGDPVYRETQATMVRALEKRWDGERIYHEVLHSQDERRLIRSVDHGNVL
jgi:choline-sulfatase